MITIKEDIGTIRDGKWITNNFTIYPKFNIEAHITLELWLRITQKKRYFVFQIRSTRLHDGWSKSHQRDQIFFERETSVPNINKLEVDVSDPINEYCKFFYSGWRVNFIDTKHPEIFVNIKFSDPWKVFSKMIDSYNENSVIQLSCPNLNEKWKIVGTEIGSNLSDTGFFEVMKFNKFIDL